MTFTRDLPSQIIAASSVVTMMADHEFIDLSHTLMAGIPTFPTHPKYFLAPYQSMDDDAEINQLVMGDHTGTHVDVPAHFVPDVDDPRRIYTHEIPIDRLCGRALTIRLGPYPATSHHIVLDDILAWEQEHTTIEPGDIVLLDTQWAHRWKLVPEGFDFLRGWPGLSGEAAHYLRSREVKAVGTDCISIDPGDVAGGDLRAHYELLPNGVLVLENLANLAGLPQVSFFMALPLRIAEGSGSPVRAIALVPKSSVPDSLLPASEVMS